MDFAGFFFMKKPFPTTIAINKVIVFILTLLNTIAIIFLILALFLVCFFSYKVIIQANKNFKLFNKSRLTLELKFKKVLSISV